MNRALITPIALCLLAGALPGYAADAAHGKTLQQDKCMSCHDNDVYTRKDRKVKSLAGLKTQVQRCELALGLQWFNEDVDDVTTYLNDGFYHFK